MEIKFALNASVGVRNIDGIITEIEKEAKLALKGENYGSDLIEIYVGWIYVSPDYEKFFKPRKPKYYEKEVRSIDGRNYELTKALECEIKIDCQVIKDESEKGVKFFIFNQLLEGLMTSIKAIKKIKNFDSERLIKDLRINS